MEIWDPGCRVPRARGCVHEGVGFRVYIDSMA